MFPVSVAFYLLLQKKQHVGEQRFLMLVDKQRQRGVQGIDYYDAILNAALVDSLLNLIGDVKQLHSQAGMNPQLLGSNFERRGGSGGYGLG